jgi:hypothetical protein
MSSYSQLNHSNDTSAVKKKTVCFCEILTSPDESTRRQNREHHHLHRYENFKSQYLDKTVNHKVSSHVICFLFSVSSFRPNEPEWNFRRSISFPALKSLKLFCYLLFYHNAFILSQFRSIICGLLSKWVRNVWLVLPEYCI